MKARPEKLPAFENNLLNLSFWVWTVSVQNLTTQVRI